MKFFILILFTFYITFISGIDSDFLNNSWVLNSYFNYLEPEKSILNIAYPSAIAYYFVSIIPPSYNYLFTGRFLEKNMYESSLTVYNQDGSLNKNYLPLNTFDTIEVNLTINNNSSELFYVFQRFYGNMEYYTEEDLIKNLFKVTNLNRNNKLQTLDNSKRNFYSMKLYYPLERIFSFISPSKNNSFTKFYLPNQDINGLFPDNNHYYLLSLPNKHKLLKITGHFKPSKLTPYMDFITINQDLIKTDNGIPFYKLQENYTIYVTNSYFSDNDFKPLKLNSSNILRWNNDNSNPALIFRLIDYSNKGITQIKGPLGPYQTKKNMEYGFYPEIEVII